MPLYSVNYDLSGPSRDYAALHELLESYGTYSHVLESFWLIVTNETAVQLRDKIGEVVDSDDKFIVMKVNAGGAAWRSLRPATSTWLHNRV